MRALEAVLLLRRRRLRTRRDRRSGLARVRRAGLLVSALCSLVLAGLGLAAGLLFLDLQRGLPTAEQLAALTAPASSLYQPARLYDRTGEVLLLGDADRRRYVPLDPRQAEHLPAELAELTVAVYDPGFYRHLGVTWAGLVGSAPPTLTGRLIGEQVLAGEAAGPRKTLRIAILAWRATEQLGRACILEAYLNSAAFGPGLYGAEAAAQSYFGKPAADLTLAETVFLVSALQDPGLDPLAAPHKTRQAQSALLGRLLVARQISPQAYLEARDQGLVFQPASAASRGAVSPFTDLVLARLNDQFGAARVQRGGLTVLTTLDLSLQRQAGCLLAGGQVGEGDLCRQPAPSASPPSASSAIVIDPRTGSILALAGAPQARHPADTLLSPFVYLAGFAQGLGPASLVWDVPLEGETQAADTYAGPERLRVALANDHAAPAWQVFDQVGSVAVTGLLAQFGLPAQVSLSTGQPPGTFPLAETPLTLIEAGRAYAVFAAEGTRRGAQLGVILAVRDALGQVLYSAEDAETQPLVSPALAYLVTDSLADERLRAAGAQALSIDSSAVKSGRSANGDWVIGYTPQRLVGVWTAPEASLGVSRASAVWRGLMQAALRGLPEKAWTAPPGVARVRVCARSGLLPAPGCPAVVDEVFLVGREPLQTDQLFRWLAVNRASQRLATVYTPVEQVEMREFLDAPLEYRAWAEAAGYALAPREYDPIPAVNPLPDVHFDAPALLQVVSGQVSLRGAAQGEGFAYYRVQVGQGLYPAAWTQIGQDVKQPVSSGELATWDTTGLDGLYVVRLLVVDNAQRARAAVLLVTVDNQAPVVRILTPQDGDTLAGEKSAPGLFRAEVSGSPGTTRVEWQIDGETIAVQSQPPYAVPWHSLPGQHSLTVSAMDEAGNQGKAQVSFTVVR